MNKTILFFFLVFCIWSNQAKSQIFTGGNASVSFFNNNFYVDVAPVVGYQIKNLRLGASPVFAYSKFSNVDENYSYGGRLFTQYTIFAGLFAHAEFEALNVETFQSLDTGLNNRVWILGAPVGAGYNQALGERINLQVMVLYNLVQNTNYPYNNPIIRGGIVYSF